MAGTAASDWDAALVSILLLSSEDEGRFRQNIGARLPNYKVSHPSRPVLSRKRIFFLSTLNKQCEILYTW
jgi:hypothetical protein